MKTIKKEKIYITVLLCMLVIVSVAYLNLWKEHKIIKELTGIVPGVYPGHPDFPKPPELDISSIENTLADRESRLNDVEPYDTELDICNLNSEVEIVKDIREGIYHAETSLKELQGEFIIENNAPRFICNDLWSGFQIEVPEGYVYKEYYDLVYGIYENEINIIQIHPDTVFGVGVDLAEERTKLLQNEKVLEVSDIFVTDNNVSGIFYYIKGGAMGEDEDNFHLRLHMVLDTGHPYVWRVYGRADTPERRSLIIETVQSFVPIKELPKR